MERPNLVLIGFSFTGKSVVGREVATRLGWRFVDSDEEIERQARKPIPRIFAEEGEPYFRELERRVLKEALAGEKVVVAAGGGAVVDPRNRELMNQRAVVVCLEAKPETIYQRLLRAQGQSVVRPLLEGPDPEQRIASLKEHRQPFYAMADWTVHTDHLSPEEVIGEVLRGFDYGRRKVAAKLLTLGTTLESEAPYCLGLGAAAMVHTATQSYPIFVGWGLMAELGYRMRSLGLSGAAFVISDDGVFPHHGAAAERALREAGFEVNALPVAAGERSKGLHTAARLYDWLVEHQAERGHAIVALGGGMVGDLAGFVAATFLRGLPLIQAPTSLMAMVDSSVGGKVAVNHPRAKNLIGAFYQPSLVLADVATLATLPRREFLSGWAEVIKHALVLDPGLLQFLEEKAEALLALDREALTRAVAWSAGLKARVVSQDEKETGIRTYLNFGHTIGHGLEAAARYRGLLHGEAVAVGMVGAARLSQRIELISGGVVARLESLLERFSLPRRTTASREAVLQAMALDKKVRGKAVRWVLLEGLGKPTIRDDVPMNLVQEVLADLLQGKRGRRS